MCLIHPRLHSLYLTRERQESCFGTKLKEALGQHCLMGELCPHGVSYVHFTRAETAVSVATKWQRQCYFQGLLLAPRLLATAELPALAE